MSNQNQPTPTTLYPISSYTSLAPLRPRFVVEVYQDPFFRGQRGIIIDNVPFTGDMGFERNISSARIYRGPGYATNPNYKVIFHEQRNYNGRQLVLEPGFYPNLYDLAYNFGGMISSVSFGPAMVSAGPDYGTIPLIVEVFREVDFKGRKAIVLRDLDRTDKIGMDEVISSIRVFRGPNFPPSGCKAIFYEHVEFEGQSLEIALGPLEYHRGLPNLYTQQRFFGGVISSIKLESWMSGGGGRFREVVFLDEFDTIKPVWQWIDPRGDCKRQLGQAATGGILRGRAGWLEVHVGPNHDLWWGADGQSGNMDAPRMLQPISGDFAIEAKLTASEQQKEHGGILVWKDGNSFVMVDKTSALHAFKGEIRFEAHVNRRYQGIGRGIQQSVVNYLRLERTGHEFQAYCSIDGQEWQSCGNTVVLMQDPVMVGMHSLCPGNIPPTITRFDYFKILRPSATSGLTAQLYTYGVSAATTQPR